MQQVTVSLRQIDQVKEFVDLVSRYPFEMDLVSGRFTVDAKSLLGIYSLDLNQPLCLVIDTAQCGDLLQQLEAAQCYRPIDQAEADGAEQEP